MNRAAEVPTEVAVGVLFNAQGQVLFAQRPEGKPYAGWWEFPGGKIEAGETVPAALARELLEELGIHIHAPRRWITRTFTYPHATVRLHFCKVFGFKGELQSLEQQAFTWSAPNAPNVAPILPAALPMLPWLCLPEVLQLTDSRISTCLTESALLATQAPHEKAPGWLGAHVSSRAALAHANALGCDFAVLAVDQTNWSALGEVIADAPIPVYASGGLGEADLARAHEWGAQGIATTA